MKGLRTLGVVACESFDVAEQHIAVAGRGFVSGCKLVVDGIGLPFQDLHRRDKTRFEAACGRRAHASSLTLSFSWSRLRLVCHSCRCLARHLGSCTGNGKFTTGIGSLIPRHCVGQQRRCVGRVCSGRWLQERFWAHVGK